MSESTASKMHPSEIEKQHAYWGFAVDSLESQQFVAIFDEYKNPQVWKEMGITGKDFALFEAIYRIHNLDRIFGNRYGVNACNVDPNDRFPGDNSVILNSELKLESKKGTHQKRKLERLGYLKRRTVKRFHANTGRYDTRGNVYDIRGFIKRLNEVVEFLKEIKANANIVVETKVDSESNVILTGFESVPVAERVKVGDILPSNHKAQDKAPAVEKPAEVESKVESKQVKGKYYAGEVKDANKATEALQVKTTESDATYSALTDFFIESTKKYKFEDNKWKDKWRPRVYEVLKELQVTEADISAAFQDCIDTQKGKKNYSLFCVVNSQGMLEDRLNKVKNLRLNLEVEQEGKRKELEKKKQADLQKALDDCFDECLEFFRNEGRSLWELQYEFTNSLYFNSLSDYQKEQKKLELQRDFGDDKYDDVYFNLKLSSKHLEKFRELGIEITEFDRIASDAKKKFESESEAEVSSPLAEGAEAPPPNPLPTPLRVFPRVKGEGEQEAESRILKPSSFGGGFGWGLESNSQAEAESEAETEEILLEEANSELLKKMSDLTEYLDNVLEEL